MQEAAYVQQLRDELMQRLAEDWPTHWKERGHGKEFINFGYVRNKNSLYAELKDEVDRALKARFGLAEASERSISADSLRRMLDERYQSGFSDKIKDAVAVYLGYDSWDDFKAKQAPAVAQTPVIINQVRVVSLIPHPEALRDWWQTQQLETAENPARRRRWQWAAGLLSLLALGYGIWWAYDYWRQHRTFEAGELSRVELKILARSNRYNPCIARFAYDFSHLNIDSATVRFSTLGQNDEREQALRGSKGTFEFYFYKPGIQTVTLTYGSQHLKTIPVIVESDGWVAWTDHLGSGPSLNYRKRDFYANGTLFLHPDKIIDPARRQYYYAIFRNTRDFGVPLGDCVIEYRLKNSPDEFGISCYEVMTNLQDETAKDLGVVFQRRGCHQESRNGEPVPDEGLNFPYTLSDWHTVRVVVKNGQVSTFLNGRLLSQNPYQQRFKQLQCIEIRSKGSGMVDFVRVYDGKGKLAYSDDFDTVPVSRIGGY